MFLKQLTHACLCLIFLSLMVFFVSFSFAFEDIQYNPEGLFLLESENSLERRIEDIKIIPKEKRQKVEFFFVNEDGDKVSSKEFQNKIIFIFFWSSWSMDCIDIMKDIDLIAKYVKDNGIDDIIPLAISIDKSMVDVERFFNQHELRNIRFFFEGFQGAMNCLDIETIPSFVVIDKNGKIAAKYSGLMRCDNICISRLVERFL